MDETQHQRGFPLIWSITLFSAALAIGGMALSLYGMRGCL